jgi:hypothetical protein
VETGFSNGMLKQKVGGGGLIAVAGFVVPLTARQVSRDCR